MTNGKEPLRIGKNTTLDKLGRITLLKEIRDLFMMVEGDTLSYYAEDGRIFIKKDTRLYGSYDFENEMIEERVKTYEKTIRMLNGSDFDDWESDDDSHTDDVDMADELRDGVEKDEWHRQFMDEIAAREKNRKGQKM